MSMTDQNICECGRKRYDNCGRDCGTAGGGSRELLADFGRSYTYCGYNRDTDNRNPADQ